MASEPQFRRWAPDPAPTGDGRPGRAAGRRPPWSCSATPPTETSWDGGVLPQGTALVIVGSFFHRDERALPSADRFEPEIWLDGRALGDGRSSPSAAAPDPQPHHLRLAVSR
jgi:hypothetical protein